MSEYSDDLQAFMEVIQKLGDRFEQSAAQSPALRNSPAIADALQQLRDSHSVVAAAHRDEEEHTALVRQIDSSMDSKPPAIPVPEPPPAPTLDPHFGQLAREELFRQFGAAETVGKETEPSRLTFSDWTNSSRALLMSASVSRNVPPAHQSAPAADDSRQRTREWFDKAKSTFGEK